jgi:hypothetical protein
MSKGTIAPTKPSLKRPVPRYDVTIANKENMSMKDGKRTNVKNLISYLLASEEGEINLRIRRNSK